MGKYALHKTRKLQIQKMEKTLQMACDADK